MAHSFRDPFAASAMSDLCMERSLFPVDPASRREARGFASERATTSAYAIGVAGTTPGVQPRARYSCEQAQERARGWRELSARRARLVRGRGSLAPTGCARPWRHALPG